VQDACSRYLHATVSEPSHGAPASESRDLLRRSQCPCRAPFRSTERAQQARSQSLYVPISALLLVRHKIKRPISVRCTNKAVDRTPRNHPHGPSLRRTEVVRHFVVRVVCLGAMNPSTCLGFVQLVLALALCSPIGYRLGRDAVLVHALKSPVDRWPAPSGAPSLSAWIKWTVGIIRRRVRLLQATCTAQSLCGFSAVRPHPQLARLARRGDGSRSPRACVPLRLLLCMRGAIMHGRPRPAHPRIVVHGKCSCHRFCRGL
jgi:hypothetical protein